MGGQKRNLTVDRRMSNSWKRENGSFWGTELSPWHIFKWGAVILCMFYFIKRFTVCYI